jgi:hypothetical protein
MFLAAEFIHNSLKQEIIKMPFQEKMVKQAVVQPHCGILLSNKKGAKSWCRQQAG